MRRKGAVPGLRKRRQQHGWMCPQPHDNAVFFFLDSLMSSLLISLRHKSQRNVSGVDRREKGFYSRETTTTLSRTLVSLTQPSVHIASSSGTLLTPLRIGGAVATSDGDSYGNMQNVPFRVRSSVMPTAISPCGRIATIPRLTSTTPTTPDQGVQHSMLNSFVWQRNWKQ